MADGAPVRVPGSEPAGGPEGAPANGSGRADGLERETGPRRLDPRVLRLWIVQSVIGAVVTAAVLFGVELGARAAMEGLPWPAGLPSLVVLLIGGLLAWRVPPAEYRHWSYQLSAEALELRHGVLTRIHSAIPYWRVQYIDVKQGPIERAMGLSRMVIHTAAASTDAEIPGIASDGAEALRRVLLARAGIGDAV